MVSLGFVLSGRAIFTVSNDRGEHYTYRVVKRRGPPPPGRPADDTIRFVQLLAGPDNTHDYSYLGIYDQRTDQVRLTLKSSQASNSKPVLVFNWAMKVIVGKARLPDGYAIEHAGRCGRCGRLLTTPESLALGLGPECAAAV